jgi:alpha-amylase
VSAAELSQQIRLGRDRVRRDLGALPKVFGGEPASDARALALLLEKEGFAGLLLEGAVPEPERRRCHRAATPGRLPALVADEALSQDLALRFSDRRWKQWPLTAEKFDAWIASAPGDVLGLSLDLGTLGLAHSRQTGIFEFFEEWVERTLSRPESRFWTASEALAAAGEDAAEPPRRTVPAGPGNEMQRDALESLAGLERRVRAAGDPAIAEDFRRLTGADHFARMALPRALDPAAPDPEPAESPYEAYMAFRHAVSDLERRLPRARPDWSAIAGPPPA